MQMKTIQEILVGRILGGEELLPMEVRMGCGTDLMSHVLSSITCDHVLLLTGLTTPQVIYVAEAVNIKAICFVGGKQPEAETIALARDRKMVVLGVDLPMFEACGKLYQAGLCGCSEYENH